MTLATVHGMDAASRWQGVRKLLVVRLDNLGDLLMTTPALAALRSALPQARLTALVSPAGAAAAEHVPALDEVIVYEAPWVKAPRPVPAGASTSSTAAHLGQGDARLIDRLAEEGFDAAVIFTVCTQSALPAALTSLLAGIPLRLAHSRENPYGLLTDWVPDAEVVADGMRHEVVRQLALVQSLGLAAPAAPQGLQFALHPDDPAHLRARLAMFDIPPDQPYFVVHPGASAPSRRYPPAAFGAAADAVAAASGCLPLFTGDAAEHALVEQARATMTQRSVSLAGCLRLGELAALIAGARLLMANNSGPAHMAAALGTPLVELYAATNPQHTPWQAVAEVLTHPVPCRNCLKSECPQGHHDCLERIPPQAVADAALRLMAPVVPQEHDVPLVPWAGGVMASCAAAPLPPVPQAGGTPLPAVLLHASSDARP